MFESKYSKYFKIAAAGALLSASSPGMSMIIDSFDQTSQTVIANNTSQVNAPEALGGCRIIEISKTGPLNAWVNVAVPPGYFIQSVDALTSADTEIAWDNGRFGLGGVDLIAGLANPAFFLDVVYLDQPNNINFTMRVVDTDGDIEYQSFAIPAGFTSSGVLSLPFSVFSPSIDFGSIDAVALQINAGEAVDLYLDNVRVNEYDGPGGNIPEPGILLLLNIGLLALGYWQRTQ